MTEGRVDNAPVSGIAMTAIGVAVIRSWESARDDRLYDDPLAGAFVEAARRAFTAERWARVTALAEDFYEGRTLGVRLVDDRVRAASAEGIRQFVLLGAGLDSRAFRLDIPADATFFEIDLPETFALKEAVLADRDAEATCDRRVVAADLTEGWPHALAKHGFRAEVPTCWIDEGTLGGLTRPWTRRVVDTLTGLSAPDSRFAVGKYAPDQNSPAYHEYRSLVAGDDSVSTEASAEHPEWDVEAWLRTLGWHTEFHSWNDMTATLGRAAHVEDPRVGTISAVRQ